MPDSIVLLREYAMQYRDGLLLGSETLLKMIDHLSTVCVRISAQEVVNKDGNIINPTHEFVDELCHQLLLKRDGTLSIEFSRE